MDNKDAYIAQLENTVKSLERQVNNLTEIIILLRKQKFGSSSEKTPKQETSIQPNLFNEAELEASPDAPEPVVSHVNGYFKRNPKTKREELLQDLPVVEIECDIHEDERICECCSTRLVSIGRETVREENVMYQKYVNSIPLYRQEKEWEQLGLALSRATMANWIIRCSTDWLGPVIEHMKKELLQREVSIVTRPQLRY